jgi:hypothetical protein
MRAQMRGWTRQIFLLALLLSIATVFTMWSNGGTTTRPGTIIAAPSFHEAALDVNITASAEAPAFPMDTYLWQRRWTPAVVQALEQSRGRFNSIVYLAAESIWDGQRFKTTYAVPDYKALVGAPVGIAIRIGAYSGPFAEMASHVGPRSAGIIAEHVTHSPAPASPKPVDCWTMRRATRPSRSSPSVWNTCSNRGS